MSEPTDLNATLTPGQVSLETYTKLNIWIDDLYSSLWEPELLSEQGHTDEQIQHLKKINLMLTNFARNNLLETIATSESPIHNNEAWRSSPLLDLPRLLHLQILLGYYRAHHHDDVRLYHSPTSLKNHVNALGIDVDYRTITDRVHIGANLGRYEQQKFEGADDKRTASIYPTRISTREWRCASIIRLIERDNLQPVVSHIYPLVDEARRIAGLTPKPRPSIQRLSQLPARFDTGPYRSKATATAE